MINCILPARSVMSQDKVIIGAERAMELYFVTTTTVPPPSLLPHLTFSPSSEPVCSVLFVLRIHCYNSVCESE